jgi:hypothetical protein
MQDEVVTIENYLPMEVSVVDPVTHELLLRLPSKGLARAEEEQRIVAILNGIQVRETRFGEITGLPEEKAGVYCVVSIVVAQANARNLLPRGDLLCVDTGKSAIRDAKNQITAVTGFVNYSQ